ncbi:MAG: hypothetical protein KAY91_02550 [Rhodocyclaceae bacterium]|jgi:hypothetical protein|uniref:Uncharacterized protein n=1 Tax=Fluviibacter phosphoraccumulans TaxID=1751046 RepID=A0A679I257_9RHOO|nr:hypothetical protein [Fluviibacter phosphoraccumulans]MBP7991520.1 hypothetical protein [Rhodocyclaceae bacterium]BBU68587.1 hypothetical protein ICHIAU1_08700 [Fluviibacter phosphoraccumulans]BBU72258.1 hypothetical protein ICHIJ1_21770 [Fluviibacter phosphoraccumulans]BCA64500.1 hypothetical protein SHINM1_001020 [Fluviibacter phosphoraccumulans]
MQFKIEIRVPATGEWVFLEMVEETMEAIANYARLLKQVYPEYRVRALDAMTMKAVVMV